MAEGGQESRGGNEDTVGIKALFVISFSSYPPCRSMQSLTGECIRFPIFFFFNSLLKFPQVIT